MSAKHTPGPWMPTLCDDGAWMVNTEGDIIVVGDNLTEANARLIAAAPELLEALQLCLVRDPTLNANAMVMAAIAKAEGRS